MKSNGSYQSHKRAFRISETGFGCGTLSIFQSETETDIVNEVPELQIITTFVYPLYNSKFNLLFDLVTSSMTSWVRDIQLTQQYITTRYLPNIFGCHQPSLLKLREPHTNTETNTWSEIIITSLSHLTVIRKELTNCSHCMRTRSKKKHRNWCFATCVSSWWLCSILKTNLLSVCLLIIIDLFEYITCRIV